MDFDLLRGSRIDSSVSWNGLEGEVGIRELKSKASSSIPIICDNEVCLSSHVDTLIREAEHKSAGADLQ